MTISSEILAGLIIPVTDFARIGTSLCGLPVLLRENYSEKDWVANSLSTLE
jgi:hypothetical protein